MEIYLQRENRKKTIRYGGTLKKLLSALKINPEEVIVAKGGKMITLDDKVEDTDRIEILSVVSGG